MRSKLDDGILMHPMRVGVALTSGGSDGSRITRKLSLRM
jgi:hypothetical protein